MKKILFPFYNKAIHSELLSKKWFKIALITFSITVIFITLQITTTFSKNLYLYCYDELHKEQNQNTLSNAHEINKLDLNDSSSELKVLQIKKTNDDWFNNKIQECKDLANKYTVYVIPFGLIILTTSFYLIQLIFFKFIKPKP